MRIVSICKNTASRIYRRTVITLRTLRRARTPVDRKAVAMLHVGRCGSTVLGNMFRQNKNFCWDGELYETLSFSRADVGVEPIRRAMRSVVRPVYGFEIKFLRAQHLSLIGLSLKDLLNELDEIGVTHYIVLERRNYLRSIVSHVIAMKTQQFVQRSNAPHLTRIVLDCEKIPIGTDTKKLLDWLDTFSREYEELRALLGNRVNFGVSYEDHLAADPRDGYAAICGFLGVDCRPVRVNFRRMNPFPLTQILENIGEVTECLLGTQYSWMLE